MCSLSRVHHNSFLPVAAQGGELLLLSGGDINTGVPESDLQDAEPDFTLIVR